MNRLERIQRVSSGLRYLMLLLAAALVGAVLLTMLVPGQDWLTLGDGQLNALRNNGTIGQGLMLALIAPVVLLLGLGIYWLQRLFSEYQQGHFFTDANMRCYLWLVWLKAGAFIYSLLWPALLMSLTAGRVTDLAITIEAGTVVELGVLLVIVHVLREAQQIYDENQGFI